MRALLRLTVSSKFSGGLSTMYFTKANVPGRAIVLLLASVVAIGLAACQHAPSSSPGGGGGGSIVTNGDLSRGQGSTPENWQPDAHDPSAATFEWHLVDGKGELKISNLKPADSRWVQKVHLVSGWYYFSADVRTEGIPAKQVGASLSMLVGGVLSQGSSGTTDWHRVGFYVNVGQPADVMLACRLGGYGSPNTGTAFYRDIQASQVDQPPPNAPQKFDLDIERGIKAVGSRGSTYSVIGTVVGAMFLSVLMLFVGWKFGLGSGLESIIRGSCPADRVSREARRANAWTPNAIEATLVIVGAAVFTFIFSEPIIRNLSQIGLVWDWSEKLSHAWATVTTIKTFHQIPLWDPYSCGGMPLLANPLFPGLTPWFGLDLLFGPVLGVNLQIPIHLAIAWTGGYVLARCVGMGVIGGLACASIFAASSWFFIQVVVGHFEMMATAYLPWILAFFWESIGRRRLTLSCVAALLFAIAFGEGGIYVCARVALLIPLLAIYLSASGRDMWPLKAMAVFALAGFGFSAIKLLPSAQLIRLHPRLIFEPEHNPVSTLLDAIFSRNQYWDHQHPPPGGFYEFGAYLSPIAAAMTAIGVLGATRRALPWLICMVLLFLLAMGSPKPWFPWALLRHLPVYSSMRIPSISLQTGFILMAAMLAGFGAEVLAHQWKYYGVIIALALVIAATWDSWQVTMPNATVTLMMVVNRIPAFPEFSQYFGGPFDMFRTALSNRGSVYCNESLDYSTLPESVVGSNQPGYRGEQYIIGQGSVRLERWTPNALTYDIDAEGNLPKSRIVVVNQNFDSAWRVAEGSGRVFSEGGLIGVQVPEGKQRLKLIYRNYVFYIGAAISFLTGVLTVLLWRYERRTLVEVS